MKNIRKASEKQERIELFMSNLRKQNTTDIEIFNKQKILKRINENLNNVWTGCIGTKHIYKNPKNIPSILKNCGYIIDKFNKTTNKENFIENTIKLIKKIEEVEISVHYLPGHSSRDNNTLLMTGKMILIVVSGINITFDEDELLKIIIESC